MGAGVGRKPLILPGASRAAQPARLASSPPHLAPSHGLHPAGRPGGPRDRRGSEYRQGLRRHALGERLDVGERQDQRSGLRPEAGTKQEIERDRAAHFVAVSERLDEHMRAGRLARECPRIRNAAIAPGEIRDQAQLDALKLQLDPHFLFNTLIVLAILTSPDFVGAPTAHRQI